MSSYSNTRTLYQIDPVVWDMKKFEFTSIWQGLVFDLSHSPGKAKIFLENSHISKYANDGVKFLSE